MAKSSIKPALGLESHSDVMLATTANSTVVALNEAERYDDGSRDIIIPKLGLVNNVGDLWKKFPRNAGDFVFEKRLVLGSSVEVIALSLRKFYVECKRDGQFLKYGDGIMPKIFTSASEANRNGYAIDFDSLSPNKVEEAGEILFLVAGPADDAASSFYIEVDGKSFAPSLMSFRRGGFREAWKLVNTVKVRADSRKGDLFGTLFTLTSFLKEDTVKKQAWFEPRIAVTRRVTEPGIASIRVAASSFIRGDNVTAPVAE